jgi:hypothetical protein
MEVTEKRFSPERFAGALLFLLVAYALVSIVVQTVLWTMGMSSSEFLSRPLAAGTGAPQFELESLAGDTVSLEKLRGSPVVLMFWGAS